MLHEGLSKRSLQSNAVFRVFFLRDCERCARQRGGAIFSLVLPLKRVYNGPYVYNKIELLRE